MGNNIKINEVAIFIVQKAKDNPLIRYILLFSALVGILTFFCKIVVGIFNIVDYHFLAPSNVHLVLGEGNWRIPLSNNHQIVMLPYNIEKDKEITMRFTLAQRNKNTPEIAKIFINFPSSAKVYPIPYKGWTWEPTNSSGNQYSLECSFYRFIRDTDWNLPALNVRFNQLSPMLFKYYIIGNKMKKIEKIFSIDISGKYKGKQGELQNYNEATSDIVASKVYGEASPVTVTTRE